MYKWEHVTTAGVADIEIHPVVAGILAARGITSKEEAEAFLFPDLDLEHDPFLLHGMEQAVTRIELALEQGERVVIHGDYDADGICSTALLSEALSALGIEALVYIPTREDGYGLQREAVDYARDNNCALIITVDCGISAVMETEYARELGIDVIITDHHLPSEELPRAVAVINPRLSPCSYPYKDLAGVGVAYKLACALLEESARELLDLVAIGTVADLVPLTGENRLYVKQGLLELATPRVGLGALMKAAGCNPDALTAGQIAFMLAPRLNAAGRLQDASLPLELLLTCSLERAEEIAHELNGFNRERQGIEQSIIDEAMAMVDPKQPAIVLYAPHWPHGVVGIVASRLVERFYRPTILLSSDDEGRLRGSGRSIAGFNLVDALRRCAGLLDKCGGHAMAAGLTLPFTNFELFKDAFNEVAAAIPGELLVPKLRIDAQLKLDDIDRHLLSDIELLSPFGMGNPQPTFAIYGVKVTDKRLIGKQSEHLRLTVTSEKGTSLAALMWGQAERGENIAIGQKVNIAFRPSLDTFAGRTSVSLRLQDFTPARECWLITNPCISDRVFEQLSQTTQARFFKPAHHFEPFAVDLQDKTYRTLKDHEPGVALTLITTFLSHREHEFLSGLSYSVDNILVYNGKGMKTALAPARADLAKYYRFFASHTCFDLVDFAKHFTLPLSVAFSVAASAANILQEVGVLQYTYNLGTISTTIIPTANKQDLNGSQTYKALHTWIKEDVS